MSNIITEKKTEIRAGGVLRFGQYKDSLIEDVLRENPGYILWLEEQDWCIVDEKLVAQAQSSVEEKEMDQTGGLSYTDTMWNPFD